MNYERFKKLGIIKRCVETIPKGIRIKKYSIAYFTLEMRDDLVSCQGIDIEQEILKILQEESN